MSYIKANRLANARKRHGYEQKQIAYLLGKTLPQISLWETGQRSPHLKTAIKLSILYKLPVRILFNNYYQSCLEELNAKAKSCGDFRPNFDLTEPTDYCTYIELMKSMFLGEPDREKIRRHIKILMDERRIRVLKH